MKRSDWEDNSSSPKRYNGVSLHESENIYNIILSKLYSTAIDELFELPIEKYDFVKKTANEAKDWQALFEYPTEELYSNLLHDYEQSNRQVKGLKEDYDYLRFVKSCMDLQKHYLALFIEKLPDIEEKTSDTKEEQEQLTDTTETEITSTSKEDNTILGVEGLAKILHCSKTTAQSIINKKILQENGAAYRVGNKWCFNKEKIDKLLSSYPNLLSKRNKNR